MNGIWQNRIQMSGLKIFGFDVFFVRASFSDLPILSGRIIIEQ